MTLTEMVVVANNYADEVFPATTGLGFANEAIARINASLGIKLPFISTISESYTALDETWVRLLIIPYITYSIKYNDGSLGEAQDVLIKFELGLRELKLSKSSAIPLEYKIKWLEANFSDYNLSNNKIEVYTGDCNKKPGMSNLPALNSVSLGTVVKVVTGDGETICSDEQVRYYRITELSSGAVKMPPLGSKNVGWF
jgi:hypothetical protein